MIVRASNAGECEAGGGRQQRAADKWNTAAREHFHRTNTPPRPGLKGPFAADPPDSVYFAPFSAKLAQVTRATDRPLRRIAAEPDDLLYVVSEPPKIGRRAIKFGLERYDTSLMLRCRSIAGQRR